MKQIKKCSFKPMNGYVVLDWERTEESTTEFGLVIPDSKVRGEFAMVVATHKNSDLVIGDMVAFDKLKGDFVKEGVVDFLIIKEDDILAVCEE